MKSQTALGGIMPALVTPYREDGTIHHQSLVAIVERCLSAGADGFYVCGSTSEAFLLSKEERKEVLTTVTEAVAQRAPVIAHIGSIRTDEAIELARHAEALGVDAMSAVPPFYYAFRRDEVLGYYQDLLGASDLPMVIYNFPASSGVTLDPSWASGLLLDPRVVAVKHTSMDLFRLERMRDIRPDLKVLNGYDEVYLGGLALGADGAIGSTFNLLTAYFREIERRHRSGDVSDAHDLQVHINRFIEVLITVGTFAGIKHLLTRCGISCGPCRRPFALLDDTDKLAVERAWERLQTVPLDVEVPSRSSNAIV